MDESEITAAEFARDDDTALACAASDETLEAACGGRGSEMAVRNVPLTIFITIGRCC